MSLMKAGGDGLLDRLRKADMLSDQGRSLEASNLFHELECESSHPQDIAALRLRRAVVLTNMGSITESQELMLTINPEFLSEESHLTYKFETGRIAAARGESEHAIMILTQALREAEIMKPEEDLAFIVNSMMTLLGSLLCDTGQPARAVPLLTRITRLTKGWERARRILGDCYFQLYKYKEAVECYREIMDARGSISELERVTSIRNIGAAYYYMRDFKQATKYLKIAAEQFGDFPELKQEIDDLLMNCSRYL